VRHRLLHDRRRNDDLRPSVLVMKLSPAEARGRTSGENVYSELEKTAAELNYLAKRLLCLPPEQPSDHGA
jgi:hypothetical protein